MSSQQTANQVVSRLWGYCSVLRDDGLSYPDYVEQLTYLLFLKMVDEQAIEISNGQDRVPEGYNWRSLTSRSGRDLHEHYHLVLERLGSAGGALGAIFHGASNKIRDPAKLDLLINQLIDGQTWTSVDIDVKGEAYEGLLERNAKDTKSGAGQYFTPRPVIDAIVACIDPRPNETVLDPACGTGGFLVSVIRHLRRGVADSVPKQTTENGFVRVQGVELVPEVARLAMMNLLLHGIGEGSDGMLPIATADSLAEAPASQYRIVLTNPPFGKRSSVTHVAGTLKDDDGLHIARPDFWVSSSNKELNFLQHIVSSLEPGGRAAVVVPEGVLSVGGVGAEFRRRLLEECTVHTILRLPPGIFYAQGVNSSVVFFERCEPAEERTNQQRLWVYDLRTDQQFSMGTKRIADSDLADFVLEYSSSNLAARRETWSEANETGRWRSFFISEILDDPNVPLNISWSPSQDRFRGADRKTLDTLRNEIVADLRSALGELDQLI